ncbi:DUF2169 domain-containing protein [Rugamonas sp.]|uniref:DUF2169 family type VI secretion system accessory protein n=1 Tax=Rugamonas sp. TaxID=1926287 RepID=UPI0025E516DD|nr:DUF2169 domain-containing protein [Rugamonas sp.]
MADTDPKPARPPHPAAPSSRPAVPGILFDNRSPYDALQFDTIDQHSAAFHVFVAKIGYDMGASDAGGVATLAATAAPIKLNVVDKHLDDNPAASVLEESDLAPFKPRCDVIVNAVAYAPKMAAIREFPVRLMVDRSIATPTSEPGSRAVLIHKTLMVCGERGFKRKAALTRMLQWPLNLLTLGMVRPAAWRLTKPKPLKQLPLRYEYAGGGQCQILHTDAAAKRVPDRERLPGSGIAADPTAHPIAHEACQSNPLGRGFARNWYLKAARSVRVAAPQITYVAQPSSARQFRACAQGGAEPAPAGMGAVGRAWLPRRALIGHIEEKSDWIPDDVPQLPANFDYGYWNCAPVDQQCPYLQGEERFILINLCRSDHPACRIDRRGNTVLQFSLLRQAMVILAGNEQQQLIVLPLVIDTVTISPETRRVDIVWRGYLDADAVLTSSRLMHITEPAQLERLALLVQLQEARHSARQTDTPPAPVQK